MTRSTLTAVAIAASVSAPAYADTYQVDKQHTEAAFQVRHLFTKVRGVFREVDGTIRFDKANPADSNVVFRLKVASIDTGVDQRDNHLRGQDFFWAEKFPDVLDYRHQLAETNSNLGQLLRELNRGREAAEVWALSAGTSPSAAK